MEDNEHILICHNKLYAFLSIHKLYHSSSKLINNEKKKNTQVFYDIHQHHIPLASF